MKPVTVELDRLALLLVIEATERRDRGSPSKVIPKIGPLMGRLLVALMMCFWWTALLGAAVSLLVG